MRYRFWFIPALITIFILAGCGNSSWIQKNPVFSNSGVMLDRMEADVFDFSEGSLTDEIMDQIRSTAADSIALGTLTEMVTAYDHAGITSARITDELPDADYVLRIERFAIKWVPTANVSHPGPNFRVRITASAWQGDKMVFRTTHSDYGNLAFTAGDGRRFYIPSEEDKTDFTILKNTLYPAIRTAFGKVWQDFLQAGRRM